MSSTTSTSYSGEEIEIHGLKEHSKLNGAQGVVLRRKMVVKKNRIQHENLVLVLQMGGCEDKRGL
jgi:hypothetical protein